MIHISEGFKTDVPQTLRLLLSVTPVFAFLIRPWRNTDQIAFVVALLIWLRAH